MTKQLIDKAPAALLRNYTTRLHDNASMAHGYLAALDYARGIHYDSPPYQPIFGVIAARLQASGDVHAFRCFVNAHADELRAEQKADRLWQEQRDWAKGEPAAVIIQRNQAAYAADQLEQAVNARGEQLVREREIAARGQAFAEARIELSGGKR